MKVRFHELKCQIVPFRCLWSGAKTCEVRKMDRDFKVDDFLLLREWGGSYTGRQRWARVTHIQTGFGLPDNVCVLSIQLAPECFVPKEGVFEMVKPQ